MIIIISCLILSLAFLAVSYSYMERDEYKKYSMLFFLLNSFAGIIALICASYLFIAFMLMGKLYV